MKKILCLVLAVILVSSIFTGCNSKGISKTEEELKAELRAEMQEELETERQKEDEEKEDEEKEQESDVSKADVRDSDSLYQFVKSEMADTKREDFDKWDTYYCDITADGSEEVVIIIFAENIEKQMRIISGDSGEYKWIPSEITVGKYETVPSFEDGFLTVLWSTGGSGEVFGNMDFYIYNGSKMIQVLKDLRVYHRVSSPDYDIEESADIDGNLTDFTYTFTDYDFSNDKSITVKNQYKYNENSMGFDVKSLAVQPPQNDISKGYTYKVESGSLKITYNNTGNTETIVKANEVYDFIKDGGVGINKSTVLSAWNEGDRLYFTVKEPDYSAGDVTYYVDINTMKIYWVGSSEIEVIRLSGFNAESIRGVQIDYSDFSAVVIPFYSTDRSNYNKLSKIPYIDHPYGMVLDFAVFGKMQEVKITRYEGMGSEGEENLVGDVENAVFNIHSNLSTDMSYYEITARVHTGEGYFEDVVFTMDEMRDSSDYDVIMIR